MSENTNKAVILWVDDEIHLLRPHILFLEEKGYEVKTATNGVDALEIIKHEYVSAALLDEMMDGLDGLAVLEQIRLLRPGMPVVMITKNEEESLMEDAIGKEISDYLTKPINPSQVLMSLKKIFDRADIAREARAREFMSFYRQSSEALYGGISSLQEWARLHERLAFWQIEFDKNIQYDLEHFLEELTVTANREFERMVANKYASWVRQEAPDIPLSPQLMDTYVAPLLKENKKTFFIVVDCMRYDHWLAVAPLFYDQFDLRLESHLSILPTATPYSRNAIFAGMFPDAINIKYPDIYADPDSEESMNRYEDKLLADYLKKSGIFLKNGHSFHKVSDSKFGDNLANRFSDIRNNDLIVLVANFVDILAHKRSVSDVLLEIVPDETGYRNVVRNWVENSYLRRMIELAGEAGFNIVISSDHGSLRVNRGAVVKADRDSTDSLRYKTGRNLVVSGKSALYIKEAAEYRLPQTSLTATYIFARDDYFFLYPNNMKKYEKIYPGTFQHGGVSRDEMLLPVALLRPKR
ncbi:MAG: bifunctional response regulator/alkaline phosphatase family protein [Candidatus Marinimicrobia bacterium]|jgi:CheY-like chemotaxis protein|nr:bifunctional response regulator/alkaline phosphatase family protein [Candidatus Neomarinimicrobiota bacterium]MDD5709865.1 bifunctional response regulator/alkaline phosphatase family protein [Candidatus Neomarinimicrobiota bacterium]MDX9777186.1 bifunctional response regulator/alkaline phosphatase family protein [bacterium]